jgi:transcriptional regulator with XRE-family HTH domain
MTLRELRKQKGLSPGFVASKLNITYRHFYRIETSGNFLTRKRAKILANLYGVKIADILKYGGDKNERAS